MIQKIFRDRYNLNMLLSGLFILGLALTFYLVYSLPANLRLAQGYQPEFIPVYLAFALTLLLGGVALLSANAYKKEIIVFRDRELDAAHTENLEEGNKTTISLDGVKSQLETAGTKKELYQNTLQAVCRQLEAGQGAFYETLEIDGKRYVELKAGYALTMGESTTVRFEFGEGLIGQCALSKQTLYIDEIPDGYVKIISGLGMASPRHVLIVPVIQKDNLLGVIEIASFTPLTEDQRKFAEEAVQLLNEKITTQA